MKLFKLLAVVAILWWVWDAFLRPQHPTVAKILADLRANQPVYK
jgi:hypothetical protein